MLYYRVPADNGVLDIEYGDLMGAYQVAETEYHVMLRDTTKARGSWTEISQVDYDVDAPVLTPPPAVADPVTENQLILMSALADIYEQMIGGV